MTAPWQEHAYKVVIEFQKSNQGVHRVIELTHRPDVLPGQLQGRIDPQVWGAFMQEVAQLAHQHPYTQRQSAGQCCGNLGGLLCVICIGFGFFEADGGNYGVWTGQVQAVIAKHAPAFAAGGAALSLKVVHGSYWVQIDINPNVAVGLPAPAAYAQQPPYPPQSQPQPTYGQPPYPPLQQQQPYPDPAAKPAPPGYPQ